MLNQLQVKNTGFMRGREREKEKEKRQRWEKKERGNEEKERKGERGVSDGSLGNRREGRKDRRWKPCSL